MAKKICIVLSSLSNGGTERFGATLSFMLTSLGYDVHIFITHDWVEYKYSGKLFSLEAESNKSLGVLGKLLCMKQYFNDNNFDIIIDNRLRSQFLKEFMVYRNFYKNSRVIGMIHNYKVSNYFPVNKFYSELIYHKNLEFIGVSEQIEHKAKQEYGFKNIKHIHNPIILNELKDKANSYDVDLPFDFILYFGRFEEVAKNLTLMIKSYAESNLPKQSVKLVLMGKGDDQDYLKSLVKELKLQDAVVFMDYNPNPFPYVKKALFTTLSSNYEGFPMSVIESLAVGTPVVSVDCDSGPREVIQHQKNGLLIEPNNEKALSSAFNLFWEDKVLYARCKQNAVKSVSHLDVNVITKQWKSLIDNDAK